MKQLPYSRSSRVADEVQKIIGTFFYYDHFDDRIKGINITGIKMTKDLRMAYVYYFISGDMSARQKCETALREMKGELKKEISQNLSLKYVPDLKFFFDESIERGERIDHLLSELNNK